MTRDEAWQRLRSHLEQKQQTLWLAASNGDAKLIGEVILAMDDLDRQVEAK